MFPDNAKAWLQLRESRGRIVDIYTNIIVFRNGRRKQFIHNLLRQNQAVAQILGSLKHVAKHGAAGDFMQNFGQARFHPRAHARCQNHNC